MTTERCVKWSRASESFFESARDDTIVLDIVVSYGCLSQTGEGFEELVNSINKNDIRKKVQKVNILDTSYLYRHSIPEFSKYSDKNVPTAWFLKNQQAIQKLKCEMEVKSWAEKLDSNEFKSWREKIIMDFAGDEYRNGIIQEFRDFVLKKANEEVLKSEKLLFQSVNLYWKNAPIHVRFYEMLIWCIQ
jgi:hypothetical protein